LISDDLLLATPSEAKVTLHALVLALVYCRVGKWNAGVKSLLDEVHPIGGYLVERQLALREGGLYSRYAHQFRLAYDRAALVKILESWANILVYFKLFLNRVHLGNVNISPAQ